jgi:hypothetical protein
MRGTRRDVDQGWRDELLLALRLRDVPGTRIGEVLAEVESHVAETGEDPSQAFGTPTEYADRVADALGMDGPRGWRSVLHGLGWRDAAWTLLVGGAAFLLADALWSLGAGDATVVGAPAWIVALLAAVALAGYAVHAVVAARRDPGDPVIDPRSGEDMVPFPRWRAALLVAVPVVLLVLSVLGGMLIGG